jgi:hypothetical protein
MTSKYPDEMAAMRAAMEQMMSRHNGAAQDDFAGLSPSEMAALRNDPFGPESPIRWRDDPAAQGLPLRRAIVALLEYFSGSGGAKLTPQGRLPQKLLHELYAMHPWYGLGLDRLPRLEEDLPVAELLHALAISQGWLRKRKGHYLLGRAGKDWLAMTPDEQALWTMYASCMRYNWAYLDGFPDMPDVQHGWGYLVWLLLQFGGEPRPVSFYADGLLRAWPFLLDFMPESQYMTREREFHALFETRAFDRWLAWLGFVSLDRERKADAPTTVTVTPLFRACWQASR